MTMMMVPVDLDIVVLVLLVGYHRNYVQEFLHLLHVRHYMYMYVML